MLASLERAERKKAKRQIAKLEADISMPPFPKAVGYIWRAYMRLRRRSAPGINGAVPVSWEAIDAFLRRTGLRFAPWEIEIIEAIDDVYLQPEDKLATPEGQTVNRAASADDIDGVKRIMQAVGKRRVVKRTKKGE